MIYFIQAVESKRIKIGFTNGDSYSARKNAAKQRLNALQVGSPEELTLLFTIEGSQSEEGALHKRFSTHRVRGEWFECRDELRAFVEAQAPTQPKLPQVRNDVLPITIADLFANDSTHSLEMRLRARGEATEL